MFPETNNGDDDKGGADQTAVVVDLTETDAAKAVKPLTDAQSGDKGGNQDDANGSDEPQRVNGSREGGDDDDDELQGAPKPWRKRLKREIRQKLEERAGRAALTEENARIRAENEQLRAQRTQDAPNTADLDSKLAELEGDLAQAIEAGDSAKQAKLNVKIAQLTSERATRLVAPRREQQDRTTQRQVQKPAGPTPTGKAFLEANDEWWNDPEQSAARAAITAIDDQLIAAGSDPNSERHYERIAKRAKEMGLKVKIRQPFDEVDNVRTMDLDDDDDDAPQRRNQRRSAPMGNNGTGRQRVNTEMRDARAGKVVIDDAARETMRTFKLDPDNPAHVKAYAKAKQERILQEAQS